MTDGEPWEWEQVLGSIGFGSTNWKGRLICYMIGVNRARLVGKWVIEGCQVLRLLWMGSRSRLETRCDAGELEIVLWFRTQ